MVKYVESLINNYEDHLASQQYDTIGLRFWPVAHIKFHCWPSNL